MRLCILFLAGVACATAGTDPANNDAAPPKPIDAADIDAAPDANTCATQPCDILTDCGCSTGFACDVDEADFMGTACRQVLTAGTETSACTSDARCDRGFSCLGVFGNCKKYCDADADCGTPRGKCVLEQTNMGTPIAGIPKLCTSNCDPTNTAAGGCPANFKCGLFTAVNGTVNVVDCSRAGAGVQGGSCASGGNGDDALCAANHLCTQVNAGAFLCRKICNRTANTGCVGAQTCIGFATPFSVGGTEFGVCN